MKRSHLVALRPTAEQRVAVPAARRLCTIRLQLGRRGIQGWPGRWRVACPSVRCGRRWNRVNGIIAPWAAPLS